MFGRLSLVMLFWWGLTTTVWGQPTRILTAKDYAELMERENSPGKLVQEVDFKEVQRVADLIDRHLQSRWEVEQVTPTVPASDAEFLRRVSLDLNGKIPTVPDARIFLKSELPHKRRELVEQLLRSPNYVEHSTNRWRNILLPEVQVDFQIQFVVPGFNAWLRSRFRENAPYDEMVNEILTISLNGAENIYSTREQLSPLAFYQAKEVKPENLAASTSRMFLGVRLECAQCHDHPFDEWKQTDFWGMAAFFNGIQRQQNTSNNVFAKLIESFKVKGLKIPGTETTVTPTYLTGEKMPESTTSSPRQQLAQWITSDENTYFAKTAANRVWAQFFGRGLVDPVDDFTDANPASHPELLNDLAKEFAAHNFDFKFLIRAITTTQAYHLSSQLTHPSQDRPELFARMTVKGLSGEQLFDSLQRAVGNPIPQNEQQNFFNPNDVNQLFVRQFSSQTGNVTERETTILQALMLMNGNITANATHLKNSGTLAAIIDYPMSTEQKIETLYLTTLTRKPKPRELNRLLAYVNKNETGKQADALSDILWALLNSTEFMFNH